MQLRLHQHGGAVAERAKRGLHRVAAIFIQQRIHPFHAQVQRAQLAVEIALCRLRQAGVAQQDIGDVLVDLTPARKPHGRQHEGLGKGIGGGGVVVARHRAAHIVPMAHAGQPAKQFAIAEIGAHQPHVRQVRAAQMRVVEDENIAVLRGVAELVDHGLYREGHDAHKDRQPRFALHQRVAGFGVVQAVAGVVRLGDDGVEGRAKQRRVHFVGDLLHPAREDGECDRVNLGHAFAFTSAMSFHTSWRVIFPSVTSNRSIKRMPLNAVPSNHSP